jgi:hypothetical protein
MQIFSQHNSIKKRSGMLAHNAETTVNRLCPCRKVTFASRALLVCFVLCCVRVYRCFLWKCYLSSSLAYFAVNLALAAPLFSSALFSFWIKHTKHSQVSCIFISWFWWISEDVCLGFQSLRDSVCRFLQSFKNMYCQWSGIKVCPFYIQRIRRIA